jgi:hypothetical protein
MVLVRGLTVTPSGSLPTWKVVVTVFACPLITDIESLPEVVA